MSERSTTPSDTCEDLSKTSAVIQKTSTSTQQTESKKLKFGVDRLLSSDTSASIRKPKVFQASRSNFDNSNARNAEFSILSLIRDSHIYNNKHCEDRSGDGPPCSECVTSLFRCCKLQNEEQESSRRLSQATQGNHVFPPGFLQGNSYDLSRYIGTPTSSLTDSLYGGHFPHSMRHFTVRQLPVYRHSIQSAPPTSSNQLITSSTQNLNSSSHSTSKRKRSWSRAVFSNLQRKGLERRFQIQKYITKPDRKQLAATLGLSDAQVKVWFQNRRMKWRHTKEGRIGNMTKDHLTADSSTQDNEEIDVDTVSD